MKKILILLAAFAALSGLLVLNKVTAVETTTTATPETTIPETTIPSGNVYYYSDLGDLIDQIYAEVRAEIYDEIYSEVVGNLTAEYYAEIYAGVIARIDELIASDSISVSVDEFQNQIYEVVTLAGQSVFGITSYQTDGSASLGTGVVYKFIAGTNKYLIITNEHVVSGGEHFEIEFKDGQTVEAILIGYDVEADVAILEFSGKALPQPIVVSTLGDSDAAMVGSIVVAVGNPKGYNFYGSVTMGVLSGVDRIVDASDTFGYLQHDASINAGNSGGPLYNLLGEVIGINVSKFAAEDIEGMGFAIPINIVKAIIITIESTYYVG